MAGDQIKVTFGAIDNLASAIDSQVKQIETQLEDLRQSINTLAQQWTGSTSESFQNVQRNWNTSADDLNATLNRIAVAVHAANDAYRHTETQNQSVWG